MQSTNEVISHQQPSLNNLFPRRVEVSNLFDPLLDLEEEEEIKVETVPAVPVTIDLEEKKGETEEKKEEPRGGILRKWYQFWVPKEQIPAPFIPVVRRSLPRIKVQSKRPLKKVLDLSLVQSSTPVTMAIPVTLEVLKPTAPSESSEEVSTSDEEKEEIKSDSRSEGVSPRPIKPPIIRNPPDRMGLSLVDGTNLKKDMTEEQRQQKRGRLEKAAKIRLAKRVNFKNQTAEQAIAAAPASMLNTSSLSGQHPEDLIKHNCSQCDKEVEVKVHLLRAITKRGDNFKCISCYKNSHSSSSTSSSSSSSSSSEPNPDETILHKCTHCSLVCDAKVSLLKTLKIRKQEFLCPTCLKAKTLIEGEDTELITDEISSLPKPPTLAETLSRRLGKDGEGIPPGPPDEPRRSGRDLRTDADKILEDLQVEHDLYVANNKRDKHLRSVNQKPGYFLRRDSPFHSLISNKDNRNLRPIMKAYDFPLLAFMGIWNDSLAGSTRPFATHFGVNFHGSEKVVVMIPDGLVDELGTFLSHRLHDIQGDTFDLLVTKCRNLCLKLDLSPSEERLAVLYGPALAYLEFWGEQQNVSRVWTESYWKWGKIWKMVISVASVVGVGLGAGLLLAGAGPLSLVLGLSVPAVAVGLSLVAWLRRRHKHKFAAEPLSISSENSMAPVPVYQEGAGMARLGDARFKEKPDDATTRNVIQNGPVVESSAPVVFANNSDNMVKALEKRMMKKLEEGDLTQECVDWLLRKDNFRFMFGPKARVEPREFYDWLKESNASPRVKELTKQAFEEMRDEGIDCHSVLSKAELYEFTKRKAFIKTEKLNLRRFFKWKKTKASRLISGAHPKFVALVAPFISALQGFLRKRLNKDHILFFTPGAKAEEVAEFITQDEPENISETDFSEYDACIQLIWGKFEIELCKRFGAPRAVIDLMTANLKTHGVATFGWKFWCGNRRKSGDPFTTLMNSIINGGAHIWSFAKERGLDTVAAVAEYFRIAVSGDDSVNAHTGAKIDWRKWMSRIGLQAESIYREDKHRVEFCSSRLTPCEANEDNRGGWTFGKKIGKVIAMMGWTINPDKDIPLASYLRSTVQSQYDQAYVYPPLRCIFDRVLSDTNESSVIQGSRALEQRGFLRELNGDWKLKTTQQNFCLETKLQLADVYDWTDANQAGLESHLRTCSHQDILKYPALEKFLDKDTDGSQTIFDNTDFMVTMDKGDSANDEYEKDLCTEGIEPNPGWHCKHCGSRHFGFLDATYRIIHDLMTVARNHPPNHESSAHCQKCYKTFITLQPIDPNDRRDKVLWSVPTVQGMMLWDMAFVRAHVTYVESSWQILRGCESDWTRVTIPVTPDEVLMLPNSAYLPDCVHNMEFITLGVEPISTYAYPPPPVDLTEEGIEPNPGWKKCIVVALSLLFNLAESQMNCINLVGDSSIFTLSPSYSHIGNTLGEFTTVNTASVSGAGISQMIELAQRGTDILYPSETFNGTTVNGIGAARCDNFILAGYSDIVQPYGSPDSILSLEQYYEANILFFSKRMGCFSQSIPCISDTNLLWGVSPAIGSTSFTQYPSLIVPSSTVPLTAYIYNITKRYFGFLCYMNVVDTQVSLVLTINRNISYPDTWSLTTESRTYFGRIANETAATSNYLNGQTFPFSIVVDLRVPEFANQTIVTTISVNSVRNHNNKEQTSVMSSAAFGNFAEWDAGEPSFTTVFVMPTLSNAMANGNGCSSSCVLENYIKLKTVASRAINYMQSMGIKAYLIEPDTTLIPWTNSQAVQGQANMTCYQAAEVANSIMRFYKPGFTSSYSSCFSSSVSALPTATSYVNSSYTGLPSLGQKSAAVHDWAISRKLRNKQQHSLNGNTKVFEKTAKTLAKSSKKTVKVHKSRKAKSKKHQQGKRQKQGKPKRAHNKKAPKTITKQVDKNAAVENKVASAWKKVMKEPFTTPAVRLGDTTVDTNPVACTGRIINLGYKPTITSPVAYYLIVQNNVLVAADGVEGAGPIRIYGWATTASESPDYIDTYQYSNTEFLAQMSGATRPQGIGFNINIQMPDVSTPGEVYGGAIVCDTGFDKLDALIQAMSAEDIAAQAWLTRVEGKCVAGRWRPLDERNLKFNDSDFNYDPTDPNAETAAGGQYAAVLLAGWPWLITGGTAASSADFDIDFIAREETIPNLAASNLMPSVFDKPKSPEDLAAIFSKVINGLSSIASVAVSEGIGVAKSAAGEVFSGLMGMSAHLGDTKMAKMNLSLKPKKSVSHCLRDRTNKNFHPTTGFNLDLGYAKYLHEFAMSGLEYNDYRQVSRLNKLETKRQNWLASRVTDTNLPLHERLSKQIEMTSQRNKAKAESSNLNKSKSQEQSIGSDDEDTVQLSNDGSFLIIKRKLAPT
jgi:hypothetical protein